MTKCSLRGITSLLLCVASLGLAEPPSRPWSGLRLGADEPALTGLELRFDELEQASASDLARQIPAGPAAFLVLSPGFPLGGERELYNRWLSWVHRVAEASGGSVLYWQLRLGSSNGAGPFDLASPLFPQLLKSTATEIRATDRDALVLWSLATPDPVAASWPEGSLAYLDGISVPEGVPVVALRGLLPRADFELWLEAPASPSTAEASLAGWLSAQRDGATAVVWSSAETHVAAALLPRLTGPEWAVTSAIEAHAPAGRQAFALLDADGRRVRVVLLGPGAAGELRLGLGRPSELQCLQPMSGQSCQPAFRTQGPDLVVLGLPPDPVVLLELTGAWPLLFEAATSAKGELSGEEVMARAEAYAFWLRRNVRHAACVLNVTWEAGDEVGSLAAELLFETASSTAWLHLLAERKNGLAFDPNRERFLFFERGGGVSIPLVQAVDEDHDYRRLPDERTQLGPAIVVEFSPKAGARLRTSGRHWLDPGSYAVLRSEIDDSAPGFPLTHTRTRTEFQSLGEGVYLPASSAVVQSGSIFGFSFSSKSRLEFSGYELRPDDLAGRVSRAMASRQPVLVWNEPRDQMVVLRKGRKPVAAPVQPSAGHQPAPDELMRLTFGEGLEGVSEATGVPRIGAISAATPLEALAQQFGGVEVLRGGDPKRLSAWIYGLGAGSSGVAPFALYIRFYLEWLGRRDWQLAILTAGVLSAVRWTDAHLGGTKWSGSLTAVLPIFPAASGFHDRGEDALDAQELRRWSPSLAVSAHRPLGRRFSLDAGIQGTYQYLGDTSQTDGNFIVPQSHLETRFHSQLELRRPHTNGFARAELGLRSAWEAWGYGLERPAGSFSRMQAGLSRSFSLGETGVISLGVQGGAGGNLDRFSAFSLAGPGGLDGVGLRLVLPVDDAQASRYAAADLAAEATFGSKLRLGIEMAALAGSDDDLLTDGTSRPGVERRFASAGATAGFNLFWSSQARLRLGFSAELGNSGLPAGPYFSFLITRNR